MVRQIIWSKLAQNDRKAILEYWINKNRSNLYSKRLNHIFEDTVVLLSKHPTIGKKTELWDIRIKIVRDYFVTYRLTDSTLEILTIWDSRQDPDKLERLITK